ncbi:MAG: hypothetical protein GKR94_00410 [Gammaproteobacteria bacterium]|nr:hypothetical protein [Gammaproteobacteria bacterium]
MEPLSTFVHHGNDTVARGALPTHASVTLSDLARALRHVWWLGGGSCAGKTSVARRLASECGVHTYHCDEHFEAHCQRVDKHRHPYFFHIKDLRPEELWMRPVPVQVAELTGFYDEEFDMVVDDLLALGSARPVLVEGAGLRPARVAPLLTRAGQALWLTATDEFRRRTYPDRGPFVAELLGQCSDPDKARDHWMRRDALRAAALERELRDLELPHLVVDGTLDLLQTVTYVQRYFGWEGSMAGRVQWRGR